MFSVEKVRFCNWFLTPAYPSNTPTWNWKLLRGQLSKWLNTIINCWRPCEWTLSTRGFLRSKMSSEYFLRRPCEWLRSTCEYRKPLEKRGGWVGSVWGNHQTVDSFHSCWATPLTIELVEPWDILGCWDTLIINQLCCLPSDIQPECSPDNMLVIDEISPEWYHLMVLNTKPKLIIWWWDWEWFTW